MNGVARFPPRIAWLCSVLLIAAFTGSCSIPILQSPDCTAARETAREFYSFHFGNDLNFSAEGISERRKFLSEAFAERLKSVSADTDPFTAAPATDPPKAFRVGECRSLESDKKVVFEVLIFWRTDERSEQRSVSAEAVNENGRWVIDDVEPKQK